MFVQVSHVKRQGNMPTHILTNYAKEVLSGDNFISWIEEKSTLIVSALAQDELNLSSS